MVNMTMSGKGEECSTFPGSEQETEPFLHEDTKRCKSNSRPLLQPVWPWIGTTILFACLFFASLISSLQKSRYGTYERGFSNELVPSTEHIDLVPVKFTGKLYYDANHTLHRSIEPDQPQYVGEPSPQIDANWEALIHNRYIAFAGSDKSPGVSLREESFQDPQRGGMYRLGVDVFHTLHCINKIRMALDRNYYHDDIKEGQHNTRLHVDHCLDYIRQMIQCKADLTPLPVYFSTGANRTIPDFERIHICRDIGKIRDWADKQHDKAFKQSPWSPAE